MARTKEVEPTFPGLLEQLRSIYSHEVERLTEALRPRILAGEFSGIDADSGPMYLALAEELEGSHPWLQCERSAHAVAAASRWFTAHEGPLGDACDDGLNREADQCMAHDILAIAAERGWVKPLRDLGESEPYAVRPRSRLQLVPAEERP